MFKWRFSLYLYKMAFYHNTSVICLRTYMKQIVQIFIADCPWNETNKETIFRFAIFRLTETSHVGSHDGNILHSGRYTREFFFLSTDTSCWRSKEFSGGANDKSLGTNWWNLCVPNRGIRRSHWRQSYLPSEADRVVWEMCKELRTSCVSEDKSSATCSDGKVKQL